jgi:hypothetical protein
LLVPKSLSQKDRLFSVTFALNLLSFSMHRRRCLPNVFSSGIRGRGYVLVLGTLA